MEERKTVLIVDDSETIRELLTAILKSRGFEIIEAESGSDALRKLNGYRPDMVITDIDMPDMNGIDLIKKLKEKKAYKDIPIIVLSSLSRKLAGVEEKDLDIAEWIEKPFSPRHLLSVIGKVSGQTI